MKKNLALLLVFVMLFSSILAVIPASAATTANGSEYVPEIKYSNLNYSDKMYLMFAVPAPATLAEGESVVLLVWGQGTSEAYSFKDQLKTVITAEAEKATIGDAQYLVFKYDGLTAADMTKIIAARPVVIRTWEEDVTTVVTPEVKDEAGTVITPAVTETKKETFQEALTYGDLVEYSVLEYITAANGGFDGITGLTNTETLELLNNMIAFGGLAQKYSGSTYEFLASDELSKIWYVPVINGVAGEKVFGGFFKKGAELATVSAPHFDEYAFNSFVDAAGNEIYDSDGLVDNGTQLPISGEGALPLDENGDLVIKANYSILYMCKPDANKATDASTNLYDEGTGNKWTGDKGGLGINLGSGTDTGDFNYSALDVVDDPYQAGNKVYRVVGNTKHNMGPGDTTNDWKVSLKPSIVPGFDDTIDPVITVDITVARGANGDMMKTGKIKLRSGSNGETAIGYFTKDGTFMLYTNGGSAEPIPVKVAETGYTRYVFVVDFIAEAIYAFAAENADEALVYQGLTTHPEFSKKGKHFKENAWMDWAMTLDRLEWWGESGNNFTDEEKNGGLLADLNGDGVGETPMINADGQTNKEAIKWCFENYKPTMLVKEYCAYVGSPVEVLPKSFTMYDVDANAATATTKNSQLQATNFGDEHLKDDQAGKTFGGIGINTSDPKKHAANTSNTTLNYAGVDVITDPYNPDNKVFSFNGNIGAVLWQADQIKNAGIRPAYTQALNIKGRAPGFFDGSIVPVITYDMTVGGNGYDRMLETDTMRFRGASATWVHLFKIAADGSILVCTANEGYTDIQYIDTGKDVQKNGYTRIVAEVDCANEVYRLYVGNEGSVLECVATIKTLWITSSALSHNTEAAVTSPKTFANWMEMARVLDRTEFLIDNTANELTAEELATVETLDAAAAQALYRAYRALLIKDWDSYLGNAK